MRALKDLDSWVDFLIILDDVQHSYKYVWVPMLLFLRSVIFPHLQLLGRVLILFSCARQHALLICLLVLH